MKEKIEITISPDDKRVQLKPFAQTLPDGGVDGAFLSVIHGSVLLGGGVRTHELALRGEEAHLVALAEGGTDEAQRGKLGIDGKGVEGACVVCRDAALVCATGIVEVIVARRGLDEEKSGAEVQAHLLLLRGGEETEFGQLDPLFAARGGDIGEHGDGQPEDAALPRRVIDVADAEAGEFQLRVAKLVCGGVGCRVHRKVEVAARQGHGLPRRRAG